MKFSSIFSKVLFNRLHHAIAGGCIEIIRMCEQRNLEFEGSLGLAVRLHQHEIFDWLHVTRFPDFQNTEESIPANASRVNNVQMILFAIEHKLDLNAPDKYGCSALSLASLFGFTDIVRLLLTDRQIDVNDVSRDGIVSLFSTVKSGFDDTVRALLNHLKIDLSIATRLGNIPLHEAIRGRSVKLLELLVYKDSSVITRRFGNHYCPLQLAVLLGDQAIYDKLFRLLADPNELITLDSARFDQVCQERNISNLIRQSLNELGIESTPVAREGGM